jgi:hypothetical protein
MVIEEKMRFDKAVQISWVQEQLDGDLKLLQSF